MAIPKLNTSQIHATHSALLRKVSDFSVNTSNSSIRYITVIIFLCQKPIQCMCLFLKEIHHNKDLNTNLKTKQAHSCCLVTANLSILLEREIIYMCPQAKTSSSKHFFQTSFNCMKKFIKLNSKKVPVPPLFAPHCGNRYGVQ